MQLSTTALQTMAMQAAVLWFSGMRTTATSMNLRNEVVPAYDATIVEGDVSGIFAATRLRQLEYFVLVIEMEVDLQVTLTPISTLKRRRLLIMGHHIQQHYRLTIGFSLFQSSWHDAS